ncbi:hypothetical protein DICPUDRAFT_152261 [Dictyostelium purpureum]|uniref:Strictosidine synthase conserved region domain-containing protein n=1 Tax=Dictyostelium purpureum TaxID=5786 RepID=F0ZKW3_DICPU|nr:uncharacterized protein DICPUDRAFT_152261 [Dictyostelium purpureum]EGC35446.1 hypothetical protein DICPUDRAFT_152261 [Dictyostelium purpureum]|eukprot:XP_003288059.1 hypothetical protein DICPUDRAFT_152261 [Dictyostelium purpureum]
MKYFNICIVLTSILLIYISILKPYSIFSNSYQIDLEFQDAEIKPFDHALYNDESYHLEKGKFVSLGEIEGPETMEFSKSGDRLYFALKNGEIRYLETPLNIITKEQLLSKQEKFMSKTKYLCTAGRPLGVTVDNEDNVIIADALKGLLKYDIKTKDLLILTSSANGKKLTFVNDVVVAKNDMIYFSNSNPIAPFLDKNGDYNTHVPSFYAIMGMIRGGQLLSYNPKTKETKVLMDGIAYANGVTLDPKQESVFVAECAGSKLYRYWISGEKAGKSEVFIDNLPGFPDGINQSNGRLYISIFSNRTPFGDLVTPFKFIKKLLIRLPFFSLPIAKPSMVVVDPNNGKVVDYYQAAPNSVQQSVTSSIEKDGQIYLGNLLSNYFVIIEDKKK